MKIKNLKFMILGILAMGCMNVSAQTYKLSDGVRYLDNAQTGEEGTAAKPYSALVYGATTAATTVTIPATFNVTDGNGATTYYKVAGFNAGWATDADVATGAGARKKISGTLTSLTIDGTNMGDLANAFTGLEKLTTVKVTSKNETWTNEGYVTGQLGAAALNGQIESLDLSGMEKVTATTGTLKGADWPKLTTVKLPSNLETLGANFFEGSKITTIDLPVTIKVIGDDAFTASELTALNLNQCTALVSLGVRAFYKAEKLAKLQMSGLKDGDKFTTIGAAAFAETAIPAANIPASVTTIDPWAFENCKKLTQLSAMAGLTEISKAMFKGCEALESVSLNANITSIGEEAFKDCKALATVAFKADPEAPVLTTIGNSAFEGCESLAALDLTATAITSVKGNAGAWFVGCTSLAEVKLPATVTSIGAEAFGDCVIENLDLSNTNITSLNAIFRRPGGVYATADKPYASLKSIILPETCTKIQDYSTITTNGVFSYCTNLKEITIPATFVSYESVPTYAFYYCTGLKTVNYLPTVKSDQKVFADDAFLGCTPLVKINTNSYYTYNKWSIPTNVTFGDTNDKVTTVKDNGGSGKYFAKYCPGTDVQINPADAKVYSIYIDGGVAYFQALLLRDGMYKVLAGEHVIIKTDEAKEITIKPWSGFGKKSVTVDEIFTVDADTPTAAVQDNSAEVYYSDDEFVDTDADNIPDTHTNPVFFNAGYDYIYRLTNNAATGGFGFTFFTGATMKAGQFFLISDLKPNAAGRIETVWLDENGFVEEDGATAIQSINKADAEDGAIYNLQGVRVNAAKKGLYIKNGKKYIMK